MCIEKINEIKDLFIKHSINLDLMRYFMIVMGAHPSIRDLESMNKNDILNQIRYGREIETELLLMDKSDIYRI